MHGQWRTWTTTTVLLSAPVQSGRSACSRLSHSRQPSLSHAQASPRHQSGLACYKAARRTYLGGQRGTSSRAPRTLSPYPPDARGWRRPQTPRSSCGRRLSGRSKRARSAQTAWRWRGRRGASRGGLPALAPRGQRRRAWARGGRGWSRERGCRRCRICRRRRENGGTSWRSSSARSCGKTPR
ncbi:hypothetical protein T484DRAFT_1944606 [Baffinella frigidus]|nr:hypothetical protein T484DRAFT_1944606 [Cryptophyta sp. CCMP2293]